MATGGPDDYFLSGDDQNEQPEPSLSIGFIENAIKNYEQGVSGNHFRANVLESGAIQPLFQDAFDFFAENYPSSNELDRFRFAEIVVVEGPDRALEAYGNYDGIWEKMNIPDTYTPPVVLFGAQGETNLALERMRDHYYTHISRRKDPRKDPRVEPIHRQDTFQFVTLGGEPDPAQQINVRYPLPPAHPESMDDLPIEEKRKLAFERRSSGFYETGSFMTPAQEGLGLQATQDEQDAAGFQPIHPPSDPADLIHLDEGVQQPQQTQQPPPDNPQTKTDQPVSSDDHQQQPEDDDDDQYWSTPEPTKIRKSKLPPLASQEAMLEFYKNEQLKQRQHQSSSPILRQQQQRPLFSPPVVNITPRAPSVPPAAPVVPQPGTVAPKPILRASPAAFPPPAVRQPSQIVPVAVARTAVFCPRPLIRASAPLSRPSSTNPPSRPSSRSVPVATRQGPIPFFTKNPVGPPPQSREETLEEIHRTEQDFPEYQRTYQNQLEEQIRSMQNQINFMVQNQLHQGQTAQPTQFTHPIPGSYYPTPQGYEEYHYTSTPQPKKEQVRFSSSVEDREVLKKQEQHQFGFQPYEPSGIVKPTPILPGVGMVMENPRDPHQKIRIRKKPETDPVLEALRASNLSEEAQITTYALIHGMRKEKKDEYEIQTVSQAIQNTSPESFDYNLRGQTPADILGPRFSRTYFSSELERMIAMKAIFQRVVDDPSCHENTKLISLRMLGQFDGPRQLREEMALSTIQTMNAFTSTLAGGSRSDSNRIEPPLLGSRHEINASTVKELFFGLGLEKGIKFKYGQGKPLHFYLHALSARITSLRLDRESAYFLLLAILDGELNDEVRRMQQDGVPFERTWNYIQNLASTPVSRDNLEKELQTLFKENKNTLAHTLTRIEEIFISLHGHVKEKEDREVLVRTQIIENYKAYVSMHYGAAALATIESLYENEKMKWKTENNLRTSQGYSEQYKFSEVRTMKEIICTHLGRVQRTFKGPSVLTIHTAEVASLSLENQSPSLPSNNPASHQAVVSTIQQPSQQMNQASMGYQQQQGFRQNGSNRSRGRGRSNGFGRRQQGYPQQQPYPNPNHMPLGQPQQALINPQQPNQGASLGVTGFKKIDFDKLTKPIAREIGVNPEYMVIPAICYDSIERGYCFNCAVPGHFVYECPLYPGQTPIERRCSCYGFHASECRVAYRDQMHAVKEMGGFHPPPPPQARVQNPNEMTGNNNQGGYGYNPNYRGGNRGYQNNGGFRGYGGYNQNQRSRGGRGGYNNNRRGYGQGLGFGGGQRRNGYGYPDQGFQDQYQQQQDMNDPSSNRTGNILGNEGVQPAPANAFMNTTHVQHTN